MATAPQVVGRHERPLWVDTCRSRYQPGSAQLGGEPSFTEPCPKGEAAPIVAVRRQAGNLSGSHPIAVVRVQHLDASSW